MAAYRSSSRFKLALTVLALAIAAATLVVAQQLVERLQARERQTADLWRAALEHLTQPEIEGDISFIFDRIVQSIDFPAIQTSADGEPVDSKNIDLPAGLSPTEKRTELLRLIAEMDRRHPPLVIAYVGPTGDSLALQRIHYGDSALVRQLQRFPYLLLGIGTCFVLLGYVGFSTIKRSEQSGIWVGLSKETAHQLGTPISSLLGWLELMKLYTAEPARQLELIDEMERDVDRLNRVATRFGQIGSMPTLKPHDLNAVAGEVVGYFSRRIPHMGKSVEVTLEPSPEPIEASVNVELFEWVLENLIKNGLDAIESGAGQITVRVGRDGAEHPMVEVTDSGRGIDPKRRKDVFRPGYTTKARGWGLGLSLSKRIIEEYHNGRLTLRDSRSGRGTTFRIRL